MAKRQGSKQWRSHRAFMALLALLTGDLSRIDGFSLTPSAGQIQLSHNYQHVLFAQRKPRRGASKASSTGSKKKKKSNNKKRLNPSEATATPSSSDSNAATSKKKAHNNNNKASPPWQVLSQKEAKLNIAKEKVRRERARQGIQEHGKQDNDDVILSTSFLSAADQVYLKWKRFNPVTAPSGLRFVGSYLDKRLPPSLGVPEIAFLGRSNVGKSSLLNRLVAAATLSSSSDHARVGKTPGATASVNLYALTARASKAQKQQSATKKKQAQQQQASPTKDLLGFVDLPGFGYAKLSKSVQESVQAAAENYLEKRRELALGILLVDARRAPPSDDDRAVLAALYDMGLPLLVVATKLDKLKTQAQQSQNLAAIQKGLGLPEGQPLAVSSVTGEGIKVLWNILLEACETSVAEFRKKYHNDDPKDNEAQAKAAVGPAAPPIQQPMYEDEEDDEIMYDQGYDWIHDDGYAGGVIFDR